MKPTLILLCVLLFIIKINANPIPLSVKNDRDSTKIITSLALAYGNESKVAIFFPKFYLTRKHYLKSLNFYYGGSIGIHPLLVTGFVTGTGLIGVEMNQIDIETSASQFWLFKIEASESVDERGAFGQSLFSFKLGYRINRVRIRFGYSLIFAEQNPQKQERVPLLDIGKINGNLFGFEVIIDL